MARITWTDLPDAVRREVESVLGGEVVEHRSHPGGYSPGTADLVVTASGRRAFVKAVHPSLNPRSPSIHRAELEVMRSLPATASAPTLLGGFERDEWVVLILEYIDGAHPTLPWQPATLIEVVDAVLDLADRLTPSPLQRPAASEALADMWGGFGRCLAEPPADLDPWVRDRLLTLDARAQASLAACDGDTLCHLDLRADNILLRRTPGTTRERLVVIDWAWAVNAARWLDATLLAAELAGQGDAASIAATDVALDHIAQRTGAGTEPLVDTLVGGAGYMSWTSRQPAPEGLPTIRAFQRQLADGMTEWLKGTRLATW